MNARDLEIFLRGLHVGIKLAEESDGGSNVKEFKEAVPRKRNRKKLSKEERSAAMKKAWITRNTRKETPEEVTDFGPKE